MSRPSHLPPRCPFQSKCQPNRSVEYTSQTTQKDDVLISKHHRFPSQGSLLEDHPSWLDDLLTDSDSSPKLVLHRRSSSDSAAILEVPTTLHSPTTHADEGNGYGSGFGASCVYGPNSPRQKSKLTNSESSMVNALLENVPRNPLQYVAVDFPSGYGIIESEVKGDFHAAAGDLDPEKAARRRSGQRSRVRKLQYIAELERTVEAFQTMGAELAAGVASLFQQRVALSLENKKLRRQIASLRQEKLIKDGQYQSLKNEVDRLKVIYGRHRRTKSATSCFEMSTGDTYPSSGTSWQTLDLGKLSLGGSSVSLGHGFGI